MMAKIHKLKVKKYVSLVAGVAWLQGHILYVVTMEPFF